MFHVRTLLENHSLILNNLNRRERRGKGYDEGWERFFCISSPVFFYFFLPSSFFRFDHRVAEHFRTKRLLINRIEIVRTFWRAFGRQNERKQCCVDREIDPSAALYRRGRVIMEIASLCSPYIPAGVPLSSLLRREPVFISCRCERIANSCRYLPRATFRHTLLLVVVILYIYIYLELKCCYIIAPSLRQTARL